VRNYRRYHKQKNSSGVAVKKIVQLAVGVATIGALYWITSDSFDVLASLKGLSLGWLAAGFVVAIANRFLMAWKWTLLLQPFNVRFGTFRATVIYCASQLWGLFLPATVGADALRIASLAREKINVEISSASIIVERLLGMLASLAILAASSGLVFVRHSNSSLISTTFFLAIGVLSLVVAVIFLSLREPLYNWVQHKLLAKIPVKLAGQVLRKIHSGTYRYKNQGVLALRFLAASLVEVLSGGLFFWLLFAAFGVLLQFEIVLLAMGVGFVLSRIPISISGLGVFEGGMSIVLYHFGLPIDLSVTVALVGRLIQISVWIPFWAVYVNTLPLAERQAISGSRPSP